MTYIARRGDAFLIDTSNDKHLFVIVTGADKNGMHLLLSVSTIHPEARNVDRTCEIPAGVHDFTKRPSFVYYRKPEQRSAAHYREVRGWSRFCAQRTGCPRTAGAHVPRNIDFDTDAPMGRRFLSPIHLSPRPERLRA